MKKTYTSNGNTLYTGISRIYGGWLLTTEGDPTTLNELEDANNDATDQEIAEINEILADPSTVWEEVNEEDAEYINGWLDTWGI